jgi:O-antigen ligase
MNELINFQTYVTLDSNFSNSYRFQTYKCGYKLLNNNIIIGYGAGNVQLRLNECYLENNAKQMVGKYNTHNQYLDITLKTGLLGLFLFLIFLIWNIWGAIKSKNNLLLMVIIFYSIVFFTENILIRQSGVILFYFLILFLNKYSYKSEKNK